MIRLRLVAATWLALVACRPTPVLLPTDGTDTAPIDVAKPPPLPAPDVVINTLEQRLLAAGRVHIVFEVESHGGIESDLRGMIAIAPDGRVLLAAQGTFAGKAGVARIECDGTTLRGASGTAKLEMPCPPAMQPALLLGLVRMGVLHNVARVWTAKPPDRAELPPGETDGAAPMNAWVKTRAHRRPPSEVSPVAGDVVAFDIDVDSQPVGDATLELGGDGLPKLRAQTVRFPGGEMRVVERYETFELDGSAPGTTASNGASSVVGAWSSPRCGERKYVRELELTADGRFRSADLVSPCPKGAVCVWSGIVLRDGTFALAGDRVRLTSAAEKSPQAKPLPSALDVVEGSLVERGPGDERCTYQRTR